jgi:hypothetical protein
MHYINHISPTQYDMFARCAEQWRRRYAEGEIIPPAIAAHIGSGFHGAAELNFTEKLKSGEDQPKNVLQDAAATAYKKRLGEQGVFVPAEERPSLQKDLGAGLDMAVALVDPLLEFAQPIQPALVEHRSTLEVDGLPQILGFIDLYTTERQLSDLKTVKRKWSQQQADTATQLTVYREMVKHELGAAPDVQTIDCFVKTKTPKYERVETVRQDEDFKVLTEKMRLMMRMVNAGIFPPADPGSWVCSPRWCGYWYSCSAIPAYRKILPKRSE